MMVAFSLGMVSGVVQLQAFLPIRFSLLNCDWLAVANEPTVVFTRVNKQKYFNIVQAWQRKLPGSHRRNSWAEKCRLIKNYFDTHKEERRRSWMTPDWSQSCTFTSLSSSALTLESAEDLDSISKSSDSR